jgi:hypothetical protein
MRFSKTVTGATMESKVARTFSLSQGLLMMIVLCGSSLAEQSTDSPQPTEMLLTEQGFVAIDPPKGWVRTAGPGLAYFIPPGSRKEQPSVWIYISSALIGPNEETKNAKAYIQSDIALFKGRFKGGIVREEIPLSLPYSKLRAPVYTFQSGEKRNVVEQVVYVSESQRALILVLSARDMATFLKTLPIFQSFAKSYRGSMSSSLNPN